MVIGENAGCLADELAFEMIPYSPQELIAIAEEQFAWCEAERLKASNELGFDDDWKAAQEFVKKESCSCLPSWGSYT